ncbi:MAG: aminopeptidase [Deltaproteobacteria bacterium]|nr:aminopeptidase [Deltaproteobacteria bacterium]
MELAKGAKKIVETCAGVKQGENVLIITDNGRPSSVAEALAAAAGAVDGNVTVMVTSPLKLPGQEPGRIVAAAMKEADVILAATTRTLGHSSALAEALKAGARCLALTECTEQTLTSGAIEADFTALKPLVDLVARRFDAAGRAHVRAPAGTDVRLDIAERKAATCSGICHEPGQMIGIPDLEVYIAPIEEKTEGRLVIDASFSGFGLVEDPVLIEVENGKVQSIKGGKEAVRLQSLLDSMDDPACRVIAELAVGLNPKGAVRGNIIEDEGVYGTGHFALGNNIGFGGTNRAPIHFDMVYWKPTIELDGEIFMEEGRLVDLDSRFYRLLEN